MMQILRFRICMERASNLLLENTPRCYRIGDDFYENVPKIFNNKGVFQKNIPKYYFDKNEKIQQSINYCNNYLDIPIIWNHYNNIFIEQTHSDCANKDVLSVIIDFYKAFLKMDTKDKDVKIIPWTRNRLLDLERPASNMLYNIKAPVKNKLGRIDMVK